MGKAKKVDKIQWFPATKPTNPVLVSGGHRYVIDGDAVSLIRDDPTEADLAKLSNAATASRVFASDERRAEYERRVNPNPSGIFPTAFKVLVTPDPVEQKTAGGIIKPDMVTEREQYATQYGTLVAVSPAAFSYDEDVKANAPKPGDRVVIAKYAGFDIKGRDGAEYRVIEDKDVCAVLA